MLASTHSSRLAAVAPAKASRAARVVLRAAEVQKAPLLNRLGGPEAIEAAVDVFYGKVGCQQSPAAVQQQLGEMMLWLKQVYASQPLAKTQLAPHYMPARLV
jgi:hypothetical protein